MVVGFTTTRANSAYHHYHCEFESRSWQGLLNSAYHHYHCEFESRSWQGLLDTTLYVMFVSDLQQVSGFL
jgi:hypothetical protein